MAVSTGGRTRRRVPHCPPAGPAPGAAPSPVKFSPVHSAEHWRGRAVALEPKDIFGHGVYSIFKAKGRTCLPATYSLGRCRRFTPPCVIVLRSSSAQRRDVRRDFTHHWRFAGNTKLRESVGEILARYIPRDTRSYVITAITVITGTAITGMVDGLHVI